MRRRIDYHLDVTLRKAEDIVKLEAEVKEKEKQIARLSADVYRFSQYASRNLRLMDELRLARDLLEEAGLDTSFITSVSPSRKRKRRK